MREQHPRFDHIGRRDFLAVGAAGLALAGAPGLAAGQAKRSGEIAAGLSERMLTLDPANHYSISTTSVLRHLFDPLVDVTNDSQVRSRARRVLAPGQQHDLALHAPQGGHLPRRHALQRGQRGLHAQARPETIRKLIKSFVYQDIESVEKDGDYAVVVTSKRPFGSLPAHLTMLGMLPPSAAKNEEAFFQKPIGTGPFRFASWTHGDQIAMTANPTYWKPGIPKVEKVTFRFIPELSTRTAALRAGELQVIDRVTPDLVETLKGTPRRQGARRARHRGPALDLPARPGAREGPAAAPGHLARHRPQRDHQGAAPRLRAPRGQPRAARPHRPYELRRRRPTIPRRRGRS